MFVMDKHFFGQVSALFCMVVCSDVYANEFCIGVLVQVQKISMCMNRHCMVQCSIGFVVSSFELSVRNHPNSVYLGVWCLYEWLRLFTYSLLGVGGDA